MRARANVIFRSEVIHLKPKSVKRYISAAAAFALLLSLSSPLSAFAVGEDESSSSEAAFYPYRFSEGVSLEEGGTYINNTGSAEWRLTVPKNGEYTLKVTLRPGNSESSKLEQKILIDGAPPFEDMTYISYPKSYMQSEITEKDLSGNDIQPENTEVTESFVYTAADPAGYHGSPCVFTLTAGEHTVTLTGMSGDAVIENIAFVVHTAPPQYSETVKNIKPQKIDFSETVQAETPYLKSSLTLNPVTDRLSYQTTPQDHVALKLNSIGGTSWQTVGQTLSYKFTVPQDGYYTIGMRYL